MSEVSDSRRSRTVRKTDAESDAAETFRLHHRRMLRLVSRDVNTSEATVEDAVSFAFLQLVRTQPDTDDSVGGWLRVVARREAIRLDRRERRTVPLDSAANPDQQTGEALTLAERLPAPVDTELAFEAREALRAVAALRWRRRRVLALKLAGYSYKEIQEKLGLTYTNVNRQLTRSRKDLEEAA